MPLRPSKKLFDDPVLWVCVLPLLYAYVRVALLLADYGVGWVLSEGTWRVHIAPLGFPTSFAAFANVFNWPLFEYLPRVTRPLSSLFELFDTPFRAALWKYFPPHPSISLTWIFSLVVSPLLLAAVLRQLKVSGRVTAITVALFVANPGVMSLEVFLFRPGKVLANAAILLCLWLTGRQQAALSRADAGAGPTIRFAVLCLVALICLFTDEAAVMLYPAMALLFPDVVFRSRLTTAIFALIPIAYVVIVKLALPELSARAGFPLPDSGYSANVSFDELLALRLPFAAYYQTVANIFENTWLIFLDTFGLIDPRVPASPVYNLLFLILVVLIAAFAGQLLRQEWRRRFARRKPNVAPKPSNAPAASGEHDGPKYGRARFRLFSAIGRCAAWFIHSPLLARASATLAIAFIFEGVLMTISTGTIIPRWWGLYYYGVFCVIFLLIVVALLLERAAPPILLQVVFALTVITSTTFIFPATNQAYKSSHYYSDRLPLDLVFTNAINRFKIPRSSADYLYQKTIELWHIREKRQPVTNVPVELTYVLYELGLTKMNTPCEFRARYFDIGYESDVWGDQTLAVHCHN
jgi:hypothetical protein